MKKVVLSLTLVAMLLTAEIASAAPPRQAPEGEAYVVQPNDWLMKIAEMFYGDPFAYPAIVEATNAKAAVDASFAVIRNPNLIRVGQMLWIPALAQPVTSEGALTLEALQNAVYQGIYDKPVQLIEGRYEGEPFVPGGASRPTVILHPEVYAFADLNGDGTDDAAVILIENSGGSGSFRYLAAVINQGGTAINVATEFVGDRETLKAITIVDGEITVDMVTHGPSDPMCCPTQEVTKSYRLQDDALIEVSADTSPHPGPTTGEMSAALEGAMWTLLSYGDPGDPHTVMEGSEITAVFDRPEGRVSGSAGCNSYFGSYKVDGDQLVVGPIAATEKFCGDPENMMQQEGAYLAALQSAAAFKVAGGQLQITNADNTIRLTFTASEERPLRGTTWQLTSYVDGEAALRSVVIDSEITAVFGDDDQVTGSAGCNSYFGSYRVDGDAITIGPLASTMMACPEPEGIMEQELAFLAALESAALYRIQSDRLEMQTADNALAVQFTAKASGQTTGEVYIVQPNDWLMKIAEKFYGDPLAYTTIVEATNAKAAEDESFAVIRNPNLIRVGQMLWIPTPKN